MSTITIKLTLDRTDFNKALNKMSDELDKVKVAEKNYKEFIDNMSKEELREYVDHLDLNGFAKFMQRYIHREECKEETVQEQQKSIREMKFKKRGNDKMDLFKYLNKNMMERYVKEGNGNIEDKKELANDFDFLKIIEYNNKLIKEKIHLEKNELVRKIIEDHVKQTDIEDLKQRIDNLLEALTEPNAIDKYIERKNAIDEYILQDEKDFKRKLNIANSISTKTDIEDLIDKCEEKIIENRKDNDMNIDKILNEYYKKHLVNIEDYKYLGLQNDKMLARIDNATILNNRFDVLIYNFKINDGVTYGSIYIKNHGGSVHEKFKQVYNKLLIECIFDELTDKILNNIQGDIINER